MNQNHPPLDRRSLLQATAAGLLVNCLAGNSLAAATGQEPATVGRPGDFDFLAGEWSIQNRRRKESGQEEWDEFEGQATCWTILGGVGSVEELRIPARNFSGMGLRLLDVNAGIWNDFWVNAKSGVLTTPGQTGRFENGVGTFSAEDRDGEQPILVRGVWDGIAPGTCRWTQSVSRDAGQTWEDNWRMIWTRVE